MAGLPIAFDLTPGQASESRHYSILLDLGRMIHAKRRPRRPELRQQGQPSRDPLARRLSGHPVHPTPLSEAARERACRVQDGAAMHERQAVYAARFPEWTLWPTGRPKVVLLGPSTSNAALA